jgi:flavin reductase (DIM6/NTAB) family NADH-FMN oxidoreductase RutF
MGGVGIVRRNVPAPLTFFCDFEVDVAEASLRDTNRSFCCEMSGHLDALIRGSDPALYVITAQHATERSGCVAGFVTQCSIYPERLLVCLSLVNHTYAVAVAADALAVHLLSGADDDLARRFGELTGDRVDKFAGLEIKTASCGAPVLGGDRPWVAGFTRDVHPFGDHVGFVIEPSESGGPTIDESLRVGSIDLHAAHPADEIRDREGARRSGHVTGGEETAVTAVTIDL